MSRRPNRMGGIAPPGNGGVAAAAAPEEGACPEAPDVRTPQGLATVICDLIGGVLSGTVAPVKLTAVSVGANAAARQAKAHVVYGVRHYDDLPA